MRQGIARLLLLITVCFAMANGPMARAALPASTDAIMAVLCIDGAAVEVALDAEGQPVPHDPTAACGDCPACALSEPAAPTQSDVPLPASSFAAVRVGGDAALPPHVAPLHRAYARGPPPEQKTD